eukprot:Em0019g1162a
MAEKPILHSYFRSSCSWRVRIALAMKGIEYEYRAVNLVNNHQLEDAYASLNPQCVVPTLEIDGQVMTQSLAIIEYLDETKGPPYLLPRDDPVLRQKVRAVTNVIACDIQPIQNLKVLKYVGDDKKAEWARYWIERGLQGLEKLLVKTAGKYSVGDEVTLADLCLVPQMYNAVRFKVDLTPFPTINRVTAALKELRVFQVSAPSEQPDCPPDLKN